MVCPWEGYTLQTTLLTPTLTPHNFVSFSFVLDLAYNFLESLVGFYIVTLNLEYFWDSFYINGVTV